MATDSLANAKRILELYGKYTNLIDKTARVSEIVHKLLDEMFISPVVATSTLSKKWGVQFNSVKKGVMQMEKLGILQELTGKQRNKLYASKELLDILLK